MKGVVIKGYGNRDMLEVVEDATPPKPPGNGEVLVRVKAAGCNPVDYKIRRGNLSPMLRLTFPAILGYDLSGVIDTVGPNVTGYKAGDEVYGSMPFERPGSYAELVCLPAERLSLKPPGMTWEESASVPLACLTAYEGLVNHLKLKPGERVLVFGGSGGVGTFAIQLAKALGASEVAATCSARNVDLVKSLGATMVLDYNTTTSSSIVQQTKPDVVLDCVGGVEIWEACSNNLPPTSRFCTAVGDWMAGEVAMGVGSMLTFGSSLLWRKLVASLGRGCGYSMILSLSSPVGVLSPFIKEGKIKPVVEMVVPLAEVRQAHERLESHRVRGKIVLKIGE